jgi:SAM-dependent methyltransferase
MAPAVTDFDRDQKRYFEEDLDYVDPRHPTAQAFVSPKLDWICSHIPEVESVLDVGAGNGTFTHYWAQRVARVEGIERSRALISKSPCASILREGDAYSLPYEDDAFDVVFESNLLHHVSEPERVVEEMRRVAKRFVICLEPNRNNLPMFLFSLIHPAERAGLKFCKRYLNRMLNATGVSVRHSTSVGMITQHRTPSALLPLLKLFDFHQPFGMYTIAIGEK